MKKIFLFFVGLFLAVDCLVAQNPKSSIGFSVEASYDTLAIGEQFQIKYSIQNSQNSRFNPPKFEGFQLLAGPMQSTNMTILNGVTKSSMTYTYVLKPTELGSFVIGKASLDTGTELIYSPELELVVVESVNRAKSNDDVFAPFGDQSFRFGIRPDDFGNFFKNPQDLFKGQEDLFNQFPPLFGPNMLDMFKNFDQLFEFKIPPVEKPKEKERVYKL